MPFAYVAAAASVIGAGVGAYSSISSANSEQKAAKSANQLQQDMFNQTTANEAPYLAAGGSALSALQTGLGLGPGGNGVGSLNAPFTLANFQQSPGYNFQMQQGENAILNNRSALGGVYSGNTLKALNQFGQGVANQDYWNAYNAYTQSQNQRFGQLDTIAGAGQNAAAGLGGLGAQVGQSIGQNIIGAGNAQAAGTVGLGQALSSGVNGLANNSQLSYLLGGSSGGSLGSVLNAGAW